MTGILIRRGEDREHPEEGQVKIGWSYVATNHGMSGASELEEAESLQRQYCLPTPGLRLLTFLELGESISVVFIT